MPPTVRPQTARLIRLEDVDRGVKSWFKHVASIHVMTPAGVKQDVSVIFTAGERWVAAADRQGIRDKDGRLILPSISISRSGFDMTSNMTALGANVPTMQLARLVSKKTSQLSNMDTLRPISSRRLRDGAVYDIFTVPFPVNGTMPYKVVIQAQYAQHMNDIVEKILAQLEFFDVPSFLIELDGNPRANSIAGGAGSTERSPANHAKFAARHPLTDYYVVAYLDGDLTDEGNITEFTDQERIIELQFSFKVPVALMLDPEGERPAIQKETTAFTVTMGDEECHAVDSIDDLDLIFGPRDIK